MPDSFHQAEVASQSGPSSQPRASHPRSPLPPDPSLFEQLFGTSADAILLLEDGLFIECNAATLLMMGGANKAVFLSQHPYQLSPEFQPDGRSSQEKAEAMMAIAWQQGNHRFEWMHRRLDGKDFWVEVALSRIQWEGRVMLMTVWQDISDRKAAEKALAESEAKFRGIVENATSMIFEITPEGRFAYVSPHFQTWLGYTVAEMSDQFFHPFVYPEDISICEAAVYTVLVHEQSVTDIQYRVIHKNGCIRWYSANVSPFRNTRGDVISILGVANDITDRKITEEALQQKAQREKLLHGIINQIRSSLDFDTILTTTVETIHQFLQVDSCTFSWHYPHAESPHWELMSEARVPDMQSFLGQIFASGIKPIADRLLRLDIVQVNDLETTDPELAEIFQQFGTEAALLIPMHFNAELINVFGCNHRQPRPWQTEEIEFIQTVMGQLAIALQQAELYQQSQAKAQELEAALQELQRTQLQMIQNEKMSSLGQLVAGVAHEINNPVSFIYGNIAPAQQYMEDILDLIALYEENYPNPSTPIQVAIADIDLDFIKEDLPQLLASMKMGANRIQQIVRSLRTFSRLDEAAYKAVDIHEGIDSTLVILENRLRPKPGHPGIQIIKHYGDVPPVECYAGQLNQVFMNILVNALDALEERDSDRSFKSIQQFPSIIQIITQVTSSNQIAIRISDNGPGIPEAIQQRIFDPFFTTKPVGQGTGMGMSISYQIITENHNGTLECISSSNHGTEFVITVPLYQAINNS